MVMLQMTLLMYAVSTFEPNETDCAAYLDKLTRFKGRGKRICEWIWQAPGAAGRSTPLTDFAAKASKDEKRLWTRRLRREVLALSKYPKNTVDIYPRCGYDADDWRSHGVAFLRSFYQALDSSRRGLPGCLFSESDPDWFHRRDLLFELDKENHGVTVCPVCEGAAEYQLEHFLPQSLYPHLICHPYNLIPICNKCNHAKGSKDPLKDNGSRRKIDETTLPYRESSNLGPQTFLEVRLENALYPRQFGKIQPKTKLHLSSRIQALEHLYKVPTRWSQIVHTVGERLFAHLKSDIRQHETELGSKQMLMENLDYRLYLLVEGQGVHPLSYVMTWYLAALINEQAASVAREDARLSPFVVQIARYINKEAEDLMGESQGNPASFPEWLRSANIRSGIDTARELRAWTVA